MRRALLVAQREFMENVRTKAFWIGILAMPVLLVLAFVVPALLERAKGPRRYAVLDRSGWLTAAVDRRALAGDLALLLRTAAERGGGAGARTDLSDPLRVMAPALGRIPKDGIEALADRIAGVSATEVRRHDAAAAATATADPLDEIAREHGPGLVAWWTALAPADARKIASSSSRARYVRVPVDAPGGDPEAAEADLAARVARGELFAYFVIGEDPVAGDQGARYVSKNLTDEELREWFSRLATAEVRGRRLARERIDPQVARWIQAPVAFEVRKATGAGRAEEVDARERFRQWAPVVLVYLLWISVFVNVQMLLTNTVEEKSSRVIEVLLSSTSPLELMAGKIAGLAAIGLTVVGSWAVMLGLGTLFAAGSGNVAVARMLVTLAQEPLLLAAFLAYFILGFLFYSALLVAIGSVVNTVKEAQNLMTPIIFALMVPILAMVPIARDPNGTLARVLSFVPPFTPFVMMNRVAGPPPLWEYLATSALLVLAIAGALWAAAKVFRVGILLTGKPPTLPEILRWVRAPVGAVPRRAS